VGIGYPFGTPTQLKGFPAIKRGRDPSLNSFPFLYYLFFLFLTMLFIYLSPLTYPLTGAKAHAKTFIIQVFLTQGILKFELVRTKKRTSLKELVSH
jgi:hypothetical protein